MEQKHDKPYEQYDDVEFWANETLNEQVDGGTAMSFNAADFLMRKGLGVAFVYFGTREFKDGES